MRVLLFSDDDVVASSLAVAFKRAGIAVDHVGGIASGAVSPRAAEQVVELARSVDAIVYVVGTQPREETVDWMMTLPGFVVAGSPQPAWVETFAVAVLPASIAPERIAVDLQRKIEEGDPNVGRRAIGLAFGPLLEAWRLPAWAVRGLGGALDLFSAR